MQAMFEAVVSGATTSEITDVDVVRKPALSASVHDVLEADAYIIGTPANLGYISGALKHFFDKIYYPCLDATRGRPFGYYIHGNQGTEGAQKAIKNITSGLEWQQAAEPAIVSGEPGKEQFSVCWELGAVVAAGVMG